MVHNSAGQYKNVKHQIFVLYKKILEQIFLNIFIGINKLPKGRLITSTGLEKIWNKTYEHRTGTQILYFHTPNWLTEYRAQTLLTKEPETIRWINSMPAKSVFWDIGANIGTFSIYAAKNGVDVVAIEPSFFNLEILNRNVISNQVSEKVTIIPIGVGNTTSQQNFYLSARQLTWGGAHNSLGVNVGFDGMPFDEPIVLKSLSFSVDDLVQIFSQASPNYLKIDVDGLEAEVLKGSVQTLGTVDSILIEVDTDFENQRDEINQILVKYNFELKEETNDKQGTSNQIWQKIKFS
jgi:FkbM family methyltransferase